MIEWRNVFWITFGLSLITSIGYIFCGSGELQAWNNPDQILLIENGNKIQENNNKVTSK